MRYYRLSEDWITYLETEVRAGLLATLRGLSLERLQKYPPPKIGGLPLGNEGRVFKRYVKGESSQLDASALSSFYRSFASSRDKLLYRAFRQNEKLSREEWAEIIGAENIEKWLANKFLRETESGTLVCQFSAVALDGLILLVDPLNDHGNSNEMLALWEKYTAAPEAGTGEEIQPFHITYIGLDSLRMIEFMEHGEMPAGGRYLDCGPGAGAILLYFSRRFDEAVGIELNARAAKLSQFNIELNELKNCRTFGGNALEVEESHGKFDLVSWNLPFIFMPEELKDESMDGFGGEMGIGLCLDFIETVPGLLTEKGVACVAALAPILITGDNVLEERLKQRLARLGLDCTVVVAQVSLAHTRELWHFHQSNNIRKFESVYLYLKHGKGELKRVEAPAARKVLDAVREKLYRRKFA
jgi:methylase of polypeptide subunit release factors